MSENNDKRSINFINQYLLLERLHSGITSELYRAIEIGEEGFIKTVLLKRFLPWVDSYEALIKDYFIKLDKYYPFQNDELYVKLIENNSFREIYYQVREYIRGQPLDRCMLTGRNRNKQLSLDVMVFIINRIIDGLALLENRTSDYPDWTCYHGHLTPSNIIIGYEGTVKILNYGIDWLRPIYDEQGGLTSNQFLSYSSPEAIDKKPLDIRSDFFSIGTIIFEMFTGFQLFHDHDPETTKKMIRSSSLIKLKNYSGRIPRKIESIIVKSVQSDPTHRFQSCEEFLFELSELIDSSKKRDYTVSLKSYMEQTFKFEIKKEISKLEEDQSKYSKALGIKLEGEDKFLEPTNIIKLNDIENKASNLIMDNEHIDLLFPDEKPSEKQASDRDMSLEDIENILDQTVKSILDISKEKKEKEEITQINFDKRWVEVESYLDLQEYKKALKILNELQENFPNNVKVNEKIIGIDRILSGKSIKSKDNLEKFISQEQTQPMGVISQAILKKQEAEKRKKQGKLQDKSTKKSDKIRELDGEQTDINIDTDLENIKVTGAFLLNGILWFLLVIVIVIIFYLFFF